MPLVNQLANSWVSWYVNEGLRLVKKTISAIDKVEAPTTKVELQSLIGKINFIQRFIANFSGKI